MSSVIYDRLNNEISMEEYGQPQTPDSCFNKRKKVIILILIVIITLMAVCIPLPLILKDKGI